MLPKPNNQGIDPVGDNIDVNNSSALYRLSSSYSSKSGVSMLSGDKISVESLADMAIIHHFSKSDEDNP
jgi:hypothetical protein